ncbi:MULTISPECIES: ABC transporter substrate-binding protein [unclassified Sulfitobacter]|uniref:ABC transporter substrate-binding protein n=1 Tax=unclassified Sulfitobacter TaxID=196795 RepID=UPI0007C2BDFC|nr:MULTISPECIES: ABC transporter substrate-binding protein [unclassified Sulfitobacter]KZY01256.1 ABC transporter permease [Sulfitobacter sp. HI0023]KZY26992.1 ABC transporter permease [Sulfitobacter sp. HI0040]KZZ66883.1 ABC transporter permease [Sulfitobacter sp. HI0129]MBO27389.1 ABC transporter permease [Paracoccaceae bacterium]
MKMKLGTMAVAALMTAGAPAMAELVFPSLSYRTGPYAAGGIPFADGYADYFTLLNERDGGIGGEMTRVPECETAYNTEKGVECYESTKGEGALVYQPLSTGITYQLIPKVTADDIPMLTSGLGRTSAKNGATFSHVFNFPANYWDGASVAIKHILEEEGGDISDKKIALVYHNSAYGKEPIRTLQELSKKHGFELVEVPVDHPGQEQKSQWLQIRRDKPDYVIMYGWGVMNQVAVQEAANIRFPMDKFIGIWWSGSENDVLPAGDKADGYKALTFHNVGSDYPLYDDLQKYVYDAGKAAGNGDQTGTVLYNRGVYAAMLVAEAAKTAQEIHGTSAITASQMRDGMENLNITEAKMAELGLPNFGPEFQVSCENHGGNGFVAVTQWDAEAQEWKLVSDFMQSDQDVIQPLIDEDSSAYASENNIENTCS